VPEPRGILDRRQLLKRLAVGGSVAWTAPALVTFSSPAGAEGSPVPATTTTVTAPQTNCGCVNAGPGKAGTVFACGDAPGCHCFTLDTGENICIPGRVACGPPCPCGSDEVCVIDSCCANDGQGTCIPRERLENGQRVCAGETNMAADTALARHGVQTLAGATH
jgi:hypothetical protein